MEGGLRYKNQPLRFMQIMRKIEKLIFCQAVGDIPYVQNIINDVPDITIIITLKSVYDIVENNNLFDTTEILFLTHPRTLQEISIFRLKYNQIKNKIQNCVINEIFIFSLGFDWISLSLLHFLSRKNQPIFHIDIYQNIKTVKKNYSLRAISRSTYYFLLTGVMFHYYSEIDNRFVVVYNDENKKITKIKSEDVIANDKPRFLKSSINYTDSVVFIDSLSDTIKKNTTPSLILNILSQIKQLQLPIIIKKHPNFDFTYSFLEKYPQADNIPIELIDLSKCKCVVGIGSSAIVNNNAPLKISLLNLYSKLELKKEIQRFKSHLDLLGKDSPIKYPKSTNELLKLLKSCHDK